MLKKLLFRVLFLIFLFFPIQIFASPTQLYSYGSTTIYLSSEIINTLNQSNAYISSVNNTGTSASTAANTLNWGFKNRILKFAATNSSLDLQNARGEIIHFGGLRIISGNTIAELRNLIINTSGPSPVLSASITVNGSFISRVNFFNLTLPPLTLPIPRQSRQLEINPVSINLSYEGASQLNQIFYTNAFYQGLNFGSGKVILRGGRRIYPSQFKFPF